MLFLFYMQIYKFYFSVANNSLSCLYWVQEISQITASGSCSFLIYTLIPNKSNLILASACIWCLLSRKSVMSSNHVSLYNFLFNCVYMKLFRLLIFYLPSHIFQCFILFNSISKWKIWAIILFYSLFNKHRKNKKLWEKL